MKALYSVLYFLFLSIGVHAQHGIALPINAETGLVAYDSVITVEGDKTALLNKVFEWFKSYYRNPSQVIRSRDTGLSKMTGKHKFVLMVPNNKGVKENQGYIIYTIKVWTKNNKVRFLLTDIHREYSVYLGIELWMKPGVPAWEENQAKLKVINQYMRDLQKAFFTYMTTEEKEYNEDDW